MVKCECGAQADPDWGQCYACWLRDRPEEQPREDPRVAEYKDDCAREYAEHCRKEYEQYLVEAQAREDAAADLPDEPKGDGE